MTIEELTPAWRADRIWKSLSLIPFVEALAIAALTTKTYFQPMFAKPPDFLGIPLGTVVEALLLGWAALGARVIWTTRSSAMSMHAFTATTIPVSVLQPFIPAVILIMQNLAV